MEAGCTAHQRAGPPPPAARASAAVRRRVPLARRRRSGGAELSWLTSSASTTWARRPAARGGSAPPRGRRRSRRAPGCAAIPGPSARRRERRLLRQDAPLVGPALPGTQRDLQRLGVAAAKDTPLKPDQLSARNSANPSAAAAACTSSAVIAPCFGAGFGAGFGGMVRPRRADPAMKRATRRAPRSSLREEAQARHTAAACFAAVPGTGSSGRLFCRAWRTSIGVTPLKPAAFGPDRCEPLRRRRCARSAADIGAGFGGLRREAEGQRAQCHRRALSQGSTRADQRRAGRGSGADSRVQTWMAGPIFRRLPLETPPPLARSLLRSRARGVGKCIGDPKRSGIRGEKGARSLGARRRGW